MGNVSIFEDGEVSGTLHMQKNGLSSKIPHHARSELPVGALWLS